MRKLYCYVDENGQETAGRIFIVVVVVVGNERDGILALCETIEQSTKKGRVKWRKASYIYRLEYLKRIFADTRFLEALRFCVYLTKVDQDNATIATIARAIQWKEPEERYTSIVYVDALSKTKRHKYARALRKFGVPTDKVQGVLKEENNALIRLADAIAGFIRDVMDGEQPELRTIYNQAKRDGFLIEL